MVDANEYREQIAEESEEDSQGDFKEKRCARGHNVVVVCHLQMAPTTLWQ
jgi:hypothetical protein